MMLKMVVRRLAKSLKPLMKEFSLRNLSKYLHVCLEKIDKRHPLSSHDVKNGCQAIGKISKAINERILIE
ncbi:MAG: hypothetical protein K0U39_05320, partial [Alphaproteobacteria bacterium]|nr:hypothetical protein [Alphaproteobacteria bacterium]